MTDKKIMGVVILVLAVALAIVSYIAFKSPAPAFDKEVYERQLKELRLQNLSLAQDISKVESDKAKRESKIDSLESLKPKIIIRYEKKDIQIYHAATAVIVNEFDSVFTSNNIR